VATIMGASDTLLAQSYSEETRHKLYDEINTASVRLNRLIENLLNMSRLETGRISPRPDWCDVHDLANKIAVNLEHELLPFKLATVIPKDMPLVLIDFGLIEQVIHNLVLNATQNATEGTQIRLKFYYDNDLLTIQVMDRGTGFPASELSSVFNKFYRGKEAKAGGTGLGLSIVKGFIEAHHGSVIAENRRNGGAIFTIKIPVKISEMDQFSKL
jgi:two-component system sensor histidine kinase KdpD